MKLRIATVFLTLLAAATVFQNCSKAAFSGSDSSVAPAGGVSCQPIDKNFAPALKWAWNQQSSAYPSFNQVMAAPMVGDLDGDGKPEVVFVAFSANQSALFNPNPAEDPYLKNGVLTVLDGATGRTKFSVGSEPLAPAATSSPLLVDLDNDGKMEIVYVHYSRQKLVALNADGSSRWTLATAALNYCLAGPSAADLDEDGRPEVLIGNWAISETAGKQPLVKLQFNSDPTYATCNVMGVVLDPTDPHYSIVSPSSVYDRTGAKKFDLDGYGFVGSGDLRSDVPGIEIVKVTGSHLRIYDGLKGALLSDVDLLSYSQYTCSDGGIGGGAPSIGRFTGLSNGMEVAVASGRALMIFDGRGNLLVTSTTSDCSSRETGVTAFDFNGDGKNEILYADEQYFRVYSVIEGKLKVVLQTVNPTGTLMEYPVVADVDGDGRADIVVVSNNSFGLPYPGSPADAAAAANITGVRVFTSGTGSPWMPTRPIWNQYHFNGSQISDRGQAVSPAASAASFLNQTFKFNSQLASTQPLCKSE